MTSKDNEFEADWTDVMVDLETAGRNPGRHGIIQIGAVAFNLKKKTICSDMFDRCLNVPPWRSWEPETREWWMQQKASVLEDILNRAEDPAVVMRALFDWANKRPGMRFWAKPTSFDYTFVQWYFNDFGLFCPWHYRTATDVNSWVGARYFPHEVPEVEKSDLGDAHNAVNDCLYQIEYVFNHYEKSK
jgi:hypothetical protein